MINEILDDIGRWLLFRLEAEQAHSVAINGLKTKQLKPRKVISDPRLTVSAAGLDFANPVGVAAGFDKNAEVYNPLLALGFGFTEVGTITPRPQSGNPKPRVFRLTADNAVINRLGFNNEGHAPALQTLKNEPAHGIVGINIGANKDSDDRIGDYVTGVETFHAMAAYLTVNISSPNTPGLRDLQTRASLSELLTRVLEARHKAEAEDSRHVPIFLKIAPDVTEADLDDICAEVVGQSIEGMIVSNTTLNRSGLTHDNREAGGLSGRPLFERSTIMLAKTRDRVGPDMTLIGVGGIDSAETALTKICAGADLVQLYTGMIYQGPHIAQSISEGLVRSMDADSVQSISDYRDRDVAKWANRALPA